MADAISGMMKFSDAADDDALARRGAVAADTTSSMVSSMMNKSSGGFMQGIEGDGLTPDPLARTYSETDDTRFFRAQDPLGSFKLPPTGVTADRNNIVLPGDRLNFNGANQDEFKDRARLKGFPRPVGVGGGRMYQQEI